MHAAVQDIVDHAERWIGGTLLDFGQAVPARFVVNEEASSLGRTVYYTPDELRRHWPRRTKIRLVQVEDGRYFAVIGEEFGCNGDVQILRTPDPGLSESPRFPCVAAGEICLLGDRGHEWHLIPTWEP